MFRSRKKYGQNNFKKTYHTIRSKTYGVICLSILFFYLFRPVLPFIVYAVDKDYISKNLCIKKDIPGNCCQGKCYLFDQIKKSGEPLNTNSDNNRKIVTDQKVEDHMPSKGIPSIRFEAKIIQFTLYSIRIIDSFLFSFFVPPKY